MYFMLDPLCFTASSGAYPGRVPAFDREQGSCLGSMHRRSGPAVTGFLHALLVRGRGHGSGTYRRLNPSCVLWHIVLKFIWTIGYMFDWLTGCVVGHGRCSGELVLCWSS